ncbi:MAG: c-type cytochrome [Thiomargarita sp.]|nr:c-type cytochrome [Thiomargarita sp.]
MLLLPVITQAEMPITRGSMLALSCTGCHGTNGKSPGAIPTIAGKSAGYLITIMKDFRDNRIFSTVMGRQAKGYTDEEITLIAEYLTTYK